MKKQTSEQSVSKRSLIAKIEDANSEVINIFRDADPYFIGMQPLRKCVPQIREMVDSGKKIIFHAGPPIEWEDMCETERRGGINGCLFEGYAENEKEARALLEERKVIFASGNDYHIVCSGSGITTPSMCVNIVEDRNTGSMGYCAPFECKNRGGLGGWGVYNRDIESYLRTIGNTVAPTINRILSKYGGLELKPIFSNGIAMGDELHSRQEAACTYGQSKLMKMIYESGEIDSNGRDSLVEMIYGTIRYFHPLGMAFAMSVLERVRNVPFSTVVTAMEGNGVTYGIKVAGLGNEWYTAPSPTLHGECQNERDVLPWIGDSSMMECMGFGGFAAAASPIVMKSMGKTPDDGNRQSEEMYRITLFENKNYTIPSLDFRGVPTCIDLFKVVQNKLCPVIHGGMMSKSGVRLGGGCTDVPMECFLKAITAFNKKYNITGDNYV